MGYFGKYGGLYNGDYFGLLAAATTPTAATTAPANIGGPGGPTNRLVRGRHREEEEALERVLRDLEPKPEIQPAEERAPEPPPTPPTAAELRAAALAFAPRTPLLAPRIPAAAFDEAAWALELAAFRAAQERDDEEALLLILEAM